MTTFKDLLHGKGNPYSQENVTRFTINDTLPQGTYVLNGGDALWFDDKFIGLGNGKVKFTTTRSYQVNNIYIIGESATLSRTKIEEDIVPFEFHIGDELPPIDTIHITQPYGENLSQGEGDVGLKFEDLELIRDNREEVLPIMYNLYQGFAYREYEGLHPEDWDIQPGDVVMVGDVEDNLHPVFVTKRELKYGSMKLFSEIPEQEEVNTNYVGTFENRTEIIVDKVNQEIKAVVEKTEQIDDELVETKSSITILDNEINEEIKVRLSNAEGEIDQTNSRVSDVESTTQTFTKRVTDLEGNVEEHQTIFRVGANGATIGSTEWDTTLNADGTNITFITDVGDVKAQFGVDGMYVNRWQTDFHTIEKFEEENIKLTIWRDRRGDE